MNLADHYTRRKLARCRRKFNGVRRLLNIHPSDGLGFEGHVARIIVRNGIPAAAERTVSRYLVTLWGRR